MMMPSTVGPHEPRGAVLGRPETLPAALLRAPDGPAWAFFAALDSVRRMQGLTLDAAGLGPVETPYVTVMSNPAVQLRRYGTGQETGPTVIIVPAPIKRPYIWDLAPEVSVVRQCVAAGARVFLLEWQRTSEDCGLADYGDRLIRDCLDAAGQAPAILLAHSLGGVFAAIFCALNPSRVAALVLLASPLHFDANVGIFSAMADGPELEHLPPLVPGSFLGSASFRAAPATFGADRWTDWLRSLPEPEALQNHLRVERWSLDEFPLPRRLVTELGMLAHDDGLVRGTLQIGARNVAPSQVTMPLLCVVDPACRIVPPESVLPFYLATASTDRALLHYQGEVGVSLQHVGMLVGRAAHQSLWPQILQWLSARATGPMTPREVGA